MAAGTAGDPALRDSFHVLSRAISRTYTLASTASSSVPTEEWKVIFDKLDECLDGRVDGRIPLMAFRQMLDEDPVWTETVPKVRMMGKCPSHWD